MKAFAMIPTLLLALAGLTATQPVDGPLNPSDLGSSVPVEVVSSLDTSNTATFPTPTTIPTTIPAPEHLINTPFDAALANLTSSADPKHLAAILGIKSVVCETVRLSPLAVDTYDGAMAIISDTTLEQVCWQIKYPNGCTLVRQMGGAEIEICGKGYGGLKCHTAAWTARHVSNACQNGYGEAKGYYVFRKAAVRLVVA